MMFSFLTIVIKDLSTEELKSVYVDFAGGVLDMCVVDFVWMDPWDSLCTLCPHQVILTVSNNLLCGIID